MRAAGICLGEGEWKINTNIFPYTVNVIVSNEMVELTIPSDIYINNQGIIQSEGISYAFKEINYGFSKSPCEGIIKIEQKNNQIFIYPKIWIKQIGTIIDETACASGSIAVAIYLNRNNCEIIQPSGGIYKIVINNHNIKLSSEYRIIK